jgi:spore coat polysaccharide biosynthesis protein SpsF
MKMSLNWNYGMENIPMSNEQEKFWLDIAQEYITSNTQFDLMLGQKAWQKMLSNIKIEQITNILECGSNIGRNINILNYEIPHANKSIIEISPIAFEQVITKYKIENSFLGSILDSDFKTTFDLVFTSGVLIHISPENLLATTKKIYELSNRYILIAEYFSREPQMIEYRGENNKLFKQDFGKYMLTNFDLKVIDYDFLWGVEFDDAGFDDLTFWIFEK